MAATGADAEPGAARREPGDHDNILGDLEDKLSRVVHIGVEYPLGHGEALGHEEAMLASPHEDWRDHGTKACGVGESVRSLLLARAGEIDRATLRTTATGGCT